MNSMNFAPKVTVVTIVRNDAQGFLITARSVLAQDYPGIEWIVIDGMSTDGTSDYVRSLASSISAYKIEKDSGIYNAMNKGIEMATGEWICFLNADDAFFSKTTVSDYVANLRNDDDVIYADIVKRENGQINMYRYKSLFWAGMIFDHQTVLMRSSIYKELRYDESYKISGDFDIFSRARIKGYTFRKVPWLIACRKPFEGGASSAYVKRQEERIRVIKSYFTEYPWKPLLLEEFFATKKVGLISEQEFQHLKSILGE